LLVSFFLENTLINHFTESQFDTTFLLVRHGETEWNTERRLQGQLDSPLTKNGIKQIESLATQFSNQQNSLAIDQIISSPLARAESSSIILQKKLQKPLSVHHSLKERSFGVWEGRMFDEIKQEPDFESVFYSITQTPIVKGESAIDARERMDTSLKELALEYKQQCLLVMTHGEILRCFLSGIDKNIDGSAYQLFENGKVFEVVYSSTRNAFRYVTN
jgi:broad specificity phosphatase PhoE